MTSALLIVLVSAFYLVTHVSLGDVLPLSVPLAQIFFFPFILLLLRNLTVRGVRFPGLVLLLALAGGMWGASVAYGPPAARHGTFVVARFPDDESESASRIFRERIEEYLGMSGVRVDRAFNSPRDAREARILMAERFNDRPLVWQQKGWLHVSFPEQLRTAASLLPSEDLRRFYSLSPVTYVSEIGLSLQPEGDGAEFLAYLFEGLLAGEGKGEGESRWEFRIAALRQAADTVGLRRSFSHRAYPLWQIGNYHLAQALRGPKVQTAELRCAIAAYRRALRFLPQASHPELRAAALNNQAIALRILGEQRSRRKLLKQSRTLLHEALRFARRPGVSQAERVAQQNLEQLRELRASLRMNRGLHPRPRKDAHRAKHTSTKRRPGTK